jgi:hypothetical protein
MRNADAYLYIGCVYVCRTRKALMAGVGHDGDRVVGLLRLYWLSEPELCSEGCCWRRVDERNQ